MRRGGPVDDVRWVRHEIHRWIYNNIKAKWPSVVRLGNDRLVQLLSGYRVSRALSGEAVRRARDSAAAGGAVAAGRGAGGVSRSDGGGGDVPLEHFSSRDLHLLVAHFLRLRFPMVLACNKMDHPAASPHVASLRAAYPLETFVPLSALAELELVRLRRAGRVRYAAGAPFQCIEVANGADGEAVRKVAVVQELIKTSGGAAGATGVLSAINAAVALRY